MRRLVLTAAVLAAIGAGVFAGRTSRDAPVGARDALAAATTPRQQRAAALHLAAISPPRLAAAYTDLANATTDRARFAAARARVAAAENDRPRAPVRWPAIPLGLLSVALAALAVRPRRFAPAPQPEFRHVRCENFVPWDAPR